MKKVELIKQLLRNKEVIIAHRLDKRLYIDGGIYIRTVGFNFVTIGEEGFSHSLDLSYKTLSDNVLDLIIAELEK